jgi:predicted transcriptional regulator
VEESGPLYLSRRERQIMDVIYGSGQASAADVAQRIPDPPTRTAVRTMLRILEEKGHLKHRKQGREFIYQPTRPRRRAGQSALRGVLATFFEGSLEKAVAAHLADPATEPTPDELARLVRLIREAKKRENRP